MLTVAVVAVVATAAAVGVYLVWPGGIQARVAECGVNARGPFAVVDLHNDSGSAFDAYMWIEFRVDGELVDRTLFVLDGYFPPGGHATPRIEAAEGPTSRGVTHPANLDCRYVEAHPTDPGVLD